ncbi:hypothetical protein BGZ60DRAFT_523661 [Tricladium varicosporioides]|nr:hypothetical protein BGZ60DRAFT_523661 [Hymenoscyphus varicosporioides]
MLPEQERAYNESLNHTGYEHGAYNQSQAQFKGNGGYAPEQPGMEVIEKKGKRTICGLATTTFALLVALILVILAAGIGGGVGGTMAVNNAKNSAKSVQNPATVTITATPTTCPIAASATVGSTTSSKSAAATSTSASTSTSSAIVVPTTGVTFLDCPKLNGQSTIVTLKSTTYTYATTCGQDFAGVDGKSPDIMAVISYSLHDCAQACASFNRNSGATICKAATFDSRLSNINVNLGTCWLKNTTGAAFVATDTETVAGRAGVILQSVS